MRSLVISSPWYTATDQDSVLITNDNFLDLAGSNTLVFHTSLGDISASNLLLFCQQIDQLIFVDYKFDHNQALFNKTIIFLNSVANQYTVYNFDRLPPAHFLTQPVAPRISKDPILWVFGCSLSLGVGVPDNKKYPEVLRQKLGLPLHLVAQSASSLRWSLRHLIHADICAGDTIIWQLTTGARFTIKEHPNCPPQEIMLKDCDKNFVAHANKEQIWFDHISLVDCGVQYLRALGVKFYMVSIEGHDLMIDRYLLEYTKYPEYCYVPDWIVDKGSDNNHPGITSHQLLSDALHNRIVNG